jgi:hypothetical protein
MAGPSEVRAWSARRSESRSRWARAVLGAVVVLPTAPAVAALVPSAVAGEAQVLWTADVGHLLPTDNNDTGPLVALNGSTLSGVTRATGSVAWRNQLSGNGGACTGTVAGGVAFVACPSGATTRSGATVTQRGHWAYAMGEIDSRLVGSQSHRQ